ncbi:MAG: glycoside hydrolase family 26 protein [Mobilitalea sp.]
MSDNLKAFHLHMGPAKCAVDLSVGSERGSYVNQDYILHKLGRPHRAINLMYCYYPLDKGWPVRASIAHASDSVAFAWDYPYDDYFTYQGGLNGDLTKEPFTHMRDVRRHGQDILLTLTIDPHVSDDHLIAIAKDLTTFGRMFLRINHEATGNWFSFNKRCTYQEVADFFVRFHKVIKEYAPNVQTILCIGGIEHEDKEEMEKETEFTEAVRQTDIWSVDKYMALHWGWPYDVAEKGGTSHKRDAVQKTYNQTKLSFERFQFLCGGITKPMVMSEFNADGDVTGPYDQVKMIQGFCDMLKNEPATWFSGLTFYQFRDDGRLGLEITDPNNKEVGIEQPALKAYKEIIHEDYFSPSFQLEAETDFPITLRWGSSEDSSGLSIPLHFEKNPIFAEVIFDDELKDLNLMMELNDHWFYKAPGVKTIDFMPAFFEKPLSDTCDINLKLFAPPATGENDSSHGADWAENYYTVIKKLPQVRLRFEPIL